MVKKKILRIALTWMLGENTAATFRAIDLKFEKDVIKVIGVIKLLWGLDIFVQGVPMIKFMWLCNIVIWLVLFF